MAEMKPLEVEQVLTMLKEGPTRIADAVAKTSPDRLQESPGTNEWSPNEVLAHLRSCADVWGGCIETILAEDHPTIRAVNPRTWIESTDYLQQDFRKSFRAFKAQREKLLKQLNSLTPNDWSRDATVTRAGEPLVRIVYDYASWLANHERPHVKQIQGTVDAVT